MSVVSRRSLQTIVCVLITLYSLSSNATTEKILHSFSSQQRGAWPVGLQQDSAGNFYGTTQNGGAYNHGTIFEFVPKAGGGWTETVLHSFSGGTDGNSPFPAILDNQGNIYGTTSYGGTGCIGVGCGVLYKLSKSANSSWTETILYTFQTNDQYPTGAIAIDNAGNIYAAVANYTTETFSVYKFAPSGSNWTKTVVYSFAGAPVNYVAIPALLLDENGNLYGTISNAASNTNGLVFKLTPSSGGSWTETTLYSFPGGNAGAVPTGSLLLRGGNLYGTTLNGGSGSYGVVFELTPGSGSQWNEKIIYTFQEGFHDGPLYPMLSAFDGNGVLYGITEQGGAGSCNYCGSVFELSPNGNGSWNETDLWDFSGFNDGFVPTAIALTSTGQIYGVDLGPDGIFPTEGEIFELTPKNSGKWNLNVIYKFPFTDGTEPYAGVIADSKGNLYGTTFYGGTNNVGAVYEMSPTANGWNEKLIYSFSSTSTELYFSVAPSNLTLDSKGNLYGTTEFGGADQEGSIFELSPTSGGGWQEQDLVSFPSGEPMGNVTFDKSGNMYVVSFTSGDNDLGAVYQVTQNAQGEWTANIIHSFGGYPDDGSKPAAGLIIDSAGNLYGTTKEGGSGSCLAQGKHPLGCGTVFELSASANGWTETVLHNFLGLNQNDGAAPEASLIFDGAGNLYGTTYNGGANSESCGPLPSGCGTVFELSPSANGWTETILHAFGPKISYGVNPGAAVVFDSSGNLYGTTTGGGVDRYGTAFKLVPSGNNTWTQVVIHSFTNGTDGAYPISPLVFGGPNTLFGTTAAGGVYGSPSNNGQGTVFELTP